MPKGQIPNNKKSLELIYSKPVDIVTPPMDESVARSYGTDSLEVFFAWELYPSVGRTTRPFVGGCSNGCH
jgi:hypothetical protein